MTPAPSSLAGLATVQLRVANGRVANADVKVTRPAAAARSLLIGKTPDEALKLVPLLFAICGSAQAAAAAQACEQALEIETSPAQRLVRDMLTAAEALNGHARFIALDWPRVAGVRPLVEEYAKVRQSLALATAAINPRRDAFSFGGGSLRLDLKACTINAKKASSALETMLAASSRLDASFLPQKFTAPPRLLPARDAAWFAARLRDRADFADRPDDDGEPALNAPAALLADNDGVGSLLADHGLSAIPLYLARCLAALAELSVIVNGLESLVAAAPATAGDAPGGAQRAKNGGEGCGVARTARGLLAHWTRIENGRIAQWRAVAPTEWNFHPQGPLAKALTGAVAGTELRRQAECLTCALDPCVPWQVVICDEGDHGHA